MNVCKRCQLQIPESSGGKCPFCGYSREDERQSNDIVEIMKSLIEERGVDIFLNPKQFYGILTDILPEHKLEKALVHRVMLDSKCCEEMFAANQKTNAQKSACIRHNAAVLESQHFMSRENALKALIWLALALGWDSSTYADCLNGATSTGSWSKGGKTVKQTNPFPVQSPSGQTSGVQSAEPPRVDKAPSPDISSTLRNAMDSLSRMLRKVLHFLFLAFLWILSISTFLVAVSSMLEGSTRAGAFLAVAGLLVIPPVHREIRKFKKGSAISIVLFVVLWVAWFIDYPFHSQEQLTTPPVPEAATPAVTEYIPAEPEATPEQPVGGHQNTPVVLPPVEPEPIEDSREDEEETLPETQLLSSDSGYLYPSDERPITRSQLQQMSREDISYIRNEIFARYGYVFEDEDIQAYFNAQSWYHANPLINASTFNDTNMTPIERANLETITHYETEQGWRNASNTDIQPSEEYLYPSNTRYITRQELQNFSREEIAYIRNEMFARYGYTFVTQETRDYFSRKSWYHADPSVNAETFGQENMNPIEQANLNTIIQYETERGWRK